MNQAMFNLWPTRKITTHSQKTNRCKMAVNNLSEAEIDKNYIIKDVITDDKEMSAFLFSLGCFKGESVTVLSILSKNYIITIKDARYSIDADLAKVVKLN